MKISVVIPLYNKRDYITRALRSLINQKSPHWRAIVVNDGSTDDSMEMVKAIDDGRISLINQPNKGVSAARNRGVRAADTEWICFLDADDELKKNHLTELTQLILREDAGELAFAGMNYQSVDGMLPVIDAPINGLTSFYDLFERQRSPVNSSSYAVKKKYFDEVGGYREDQHQFEDWTLYFKLAAVGQFAYNSTVTSIYHIDQASGSCVSDAERLYRNAVILPQEMRQYVQSGKLSQDKHADCKRCVAEYCVNLAYLLAKMNHRLLALKMLGYMPASKACSWKGAPMIYMQLAGHLLLPARLKKLLTSNL